jgi:oligopeptide/dipeptide ABC transporter ATP-binding protein
VSETPRSRTGHDTPAGDTGGEALLSVENLKTHFPVGGGLLGSGKNVVKAVDGASFDIRGGEVFGLVGESGSGKTTLGRSVLNLVDPTSGHVRYRGRDLTTLSEKEMRLLRRELSLIFQDPNASLNPAMTIEQGVGHPLRIHGVVQSRAQARERVVLKRDLDLTYLFITHDLATARFMCDRIGILYLGNFVEQGPADRLFDSPQHPYTRALLSAIPLPEAGRGSREKVLPRGEIPDAARPPAGCRFHPRCPEAFAVCGWEGQDLVDALEERWTDVDEDTLQREMDLVGGLGNAEVGREFVHFPSGDPARLADWLKEQGPHLPSQVFSGVIEVAAERGGVTVRFRSGPEPDTQEVMGRRVACHLYGVRVRPDGDHVGNPDPEELAGFQPPAPSWRAHEG